MEDMKKIEDFDTCELLDELLGRKNWISEIESYVLVEALQQKSKVISIETKYNYQNYVVAIENGEIYKDTGNVTILIVED